MLTYEQQIMAKYLRENDWESLWDEDNWIRNSYRNNPEINLDWAGVTLNTAFNTCCKENNVKPEEILLKPL